MSGALDKLTSKLYSLFINVGLEAIHLFVVS